MINNHAVCDTVVLILEKDEFEIQEPDVFTPSANIVFASRSGKTVSAYCNPSKMDLREHNFKPCLTLTKSPRVGGMSIVLKVSASLPKLVRGNNLEEISDEDFPKIIDRLQEKLKEVSVLVSKDKLINARVCSIHYSKNILLPKGIDCSLIIREIEHSEFSKALDVGRSDYRNHGHCARIHTNEWELAVYDKLRDFQQGLSKSDKRAFERGSAYQNLNIEAFNGLSILRIESRLNSSNQLRRVFSKVGVDIKELTFANLFSSNLNQKVNEYFWEKIAKSRKVLEPLRDDAGNFFRKLTTDFKPLCALELLGLWTALKHCGAREVKYLLIKSPTVPKLIKKLKNIQTDGDWMSEIFDFVHETIKKNEKLNFKGKKNEK